MIYKDLDWSHFVDIKNNICTIDMENIEYELAQIAGIYTLWAGLQKLAKRELDREELDLTSWIAQTRKEHRGTSTSKMSDAYLTEYVQALEEYKERNEKVIEKEYKYKLLTSITEGLHQKRDALVQISSNKRAEAKIFN